MLNKIFDLIGSILWFLSGRKEPDIKEIREVYNSLSQESKELADKYLEQLVQKEKEERKNK